MAAKRPLNAPLVTGFTSYCSGDTAIDVYWTDTNNSETGYEIQGSEDPTFLTGVFTVNVGANITTTQWTGLTPNTTYFGRVRAVRGAEVSPWSLIYDATTMDPDAWAYIQYIEAECDVTECSAAQAFFYHLKYGGPRDLFALADYIYLISEFAAVGVDPALVDCKNLTLATNVGSIAMINGNGWEFDGAGYIDTGFNLLTDSVQASGVEFLQMFTWYAKTSSAGQYLYGTDDSLGKKHSVQIDADSGGQWLIGMACDGGDTANLGEYGQAQPVMFALTVGGNDINIPSPVAIWSSSAGQFENPNAQASSNSSLAFPSLNQIAGGLNYTGTAQDFTDGDYMMFFAQFKLPDDANESDLNIIREAYLYYNQIRGRA